MGLRVLITNLSLKWRTGTELYVRDLALELRRQGHAPAVYTAAVGPVAEEVRAAGVPVSTRLSSLELRPDVIHGHHYPLVLAALARCPATPAIFLSHDHTFWLDRPPRHGRLRRYYAVSAICLERLIVDGAPEEQCGLLLNFVDTKRFLPRPPLPERPQRALLFSNYAKRQTQIPAVTEACRRAGLRLDIVGAGVDRIAARPEDLLGHYDLVFAKARAAMEAMAVGAAVVMCDFAGAGPMVSSGEFDRLRRLNFGFEALRDPLAPEPLLREIGRYDPHDAAKVRDRLRSCASLDGTVKDLVGIYQGVIAEHAKVPATAGRAEPRAGRVLLARDTLAMRGLLAWLSLPPTYRDALSRPRWIRAGKDLMKKLFVPSRRGDPG